MRDTIVTGVAQIDKPYRVVHVRMSIVLLSVLLVAAVVVSSSRSAEPRIIAHRGASSGAPENTLAAFRLAWQQEADGIEGDFRLTKDGRIVCIHDADTKRLAGQSLVVADTTFEQLQALDVGAWKGESWRGESVPALEDVLATVPAGKKVVLELKTGPEIVPPLAEAIERSSLQADQFLVIAFDAETIAACKQRLPALRCHWLSAYKQQDDGTWKPTPDEVIATIRRVGADGLGSESKPEVFNQAFVERLRDAGIDEFHVWTVDDVKVAQFYRRLGAWGLTTNRPGELRNELLGN